MDEREEKINHVLVHLFNDLLRIEETTLRSRGIKSLSLREIHIIEAVCAAVEDNSTMSALASTLRVTVGSLTVAVETLIRKGYVVRVRSSVDRRRIHVLPTEKALAVDKIHRQYHEQMTHKAMEAVPEGQLDMFVDVLDAVSQFFYEQDREDKQ